VSFFSSLFISQHKDKDRAAHPVVAGDAAADENIAPDEQHIYLSIYISAYISQLIYLSLYISAYISQHDDKDRAAHRVVASDVAAHQNIAPDETK
jgi:nitrogen fixation-related uncharacterized protein